MRAVPLTRRAAAFALLLAGCLPGSPCSAAGPGRLYDEVIDSPMYQAPELPVPREVPSFPDELKGLWLKALARPEAEMRLRAADTIALAHHRGMKGLETTVGPLVAALDQPDQHPAVRLAATRALVALDARPAAPSLLAQAQAGDGHLRDLVEPALARWDYRPARAVWLERLREPATPPRDLVRAMRALAEVREGQAAERLREIALSSRVSGPLRLEAARALAALRGEGLEKDAEGLAGDESPRGVVSRLVAASLLQGHKGADAVRTLQRLARDPEPAVSALAAARLLALGPELTLPALDHLLASPDARCRALGVEALFKQPTEKHVRLLADRLDDPHPDVRLQARRSLEGLATKQGRREQIVAEATRVLAARSWRGLEQAAILLMLLDHKPAAGRLTQLLAADRPEVFITAAWGLRRLSVPESLPDALRYVQARLGGAPAGTDPDLLDHQLSQLNQLFGLRKYRPAEAALRRFIPRGPHGPESRAAAIWALGLLHDGQAVPDLVAPLEGRLNDVRSMPPEDNRVRAMAAVTLGRTRAKGAVPSLQRYCPTGTPSEDRVNNACGWALERLTGKAIPPPQTFKKPERGWFLTPSR